MSTHIIVLTEIEHIIHTRHLYSSSKRNIILGVGGMLMDYMTLKEASEKWGISTRMINYYCTEDRIPGAVKMATVWLIPKKAEKPIDRRYKKRGENNAAHSDL